MKINEKSIYSGYLRELQKFSITIFLTLKRISVFAVYFFPQSYVQCHFWSCGIPAEWRLTHFMIISRYSFIVVLKNGIGNKVFYSVASRKLVYFSKCDGSIYLLWAFWSLTFNFFFKRGNYEEHPLSKCG